MLDENLPTFIFRPMPDHPSSAVVYFTRSGSDPAPEYVLRLADPVSKPACRGVYAVALTDPYNSNDVVYGEVAVSPEWQQPTLSAAELRERRESNGDSTAVAPAAKVPDVFTIQLYNPDQTVVVRWTPGSWNKTESWEFEIPIETFRMPSASRLDRQAPQETASSSATDGAAAIGVLPKNAFRWKRDGRLGNKDMTCYMVGTTVGLRRSKEPDITVALFKHGRDPAVTIYEPNLQRVDVQDRKGLELVLLLGAQVIRDLYVVPRPDPFNMEGAASAAAAAAPSSRRKSSGARPVSTYNALPTMAGAMPNSTMSASSIPPSAAHAVPAATSSASSSTPSAAAIDAETKRLQIMLEHEERERAKREKDEERRIKKMLEAEEKERRRREAEVAKETERLRKLYGTDGQDLPSSVPPPPGPPPSSSASYNRPVPPPPPPPIGSNGYYSHAHGSSGYYQNPPLPARPVSAGPANRWNAPSGSGSNKKTSGFLSNPAASVSGFFSSSSSSGGRRDRASSGGGTLSADERRRIQKKGSVHF